MVEGLEMAIEDAEQVKAAVGRAAVDRFVARGMRVGLGTGSTAIWAARRVGELYRSGALAGLRVVATSLQTELESRAMGLPVVTLNDAGLEDGLDLTIDGADEVDPSGNLIKGGGGALLMEKIVAYASARFVVVVDEGKLSPRVGSRFPVPLEVLPAAFVPVRRALESLGAEVSLRMAVHKAGPVVTDLGNLLVDARFADPFEPAAMERELDAIAGALGNGVFTRRTPLVLVGHPDGTVEERRF